MTLSAKIAAAEALFGREEQTSARTAMAVATEASENGVVNIQFNEEDEGAPIECIGSVSAGEEVNVLIQNGDAIVVGAAGWGDAQNQAIEDNAQRVNEVSESLVEVQSQFEGVQVNLKSLSEQLKGIGFWVQTTGNGLLLGNEGNTFHILLNEQELGFYDGGTEVAYLNNESLYIGKARIVSEMQVGNFLWCPRDDGSMYLAWVEG